MTKGTYPTWKDEWSKQATAKFEIMRAAFVAKFGGEMFRVQEYDHALFGNPRLTFTHHGEFLEEHFPCSSVAWDANPELREWPNYSLTIATMAPGEWMWNRLKHQYDLDRVSQRRLPKNSEFRDVVRAGVDRGFHELVAHMLVPNPTGSRPSPGAIRAWSRRQPFIEHKIAVEYDIRHYPQRHASWNQREHTQVEFTSKHHGARSVYALYSVQAERWCVVR